MNAPLAPSLAQVAARPALDFHDVAVRFKSYTAVRNVTLSIADGEFVSVVGPTGCGKSTLLNVAAGLLAPAEGRVDVFGAPLSKLNRHAGYMFQADSLMPWFSALDNVTLGLEFRGESRRRCREHAQGWLARVGLSGHEHKYPHQMSGGMRKRAALAQMLILDPKILLMDEPFSALDIQTRQLMENELLDLWQGDRKSVMFITHDLEEAISLSDRVVVLSAGPAARVVGEFRIDLPRPRDVAEVRLTQRFLELHEQIWGVMREEVLKSYQQAREAERGRPTAPIKQIRTERY